MLGAPLIVYWSRDSNILNHDDMEMVRHVLRDHPVHKTLHLALTSSGGNGEAAMRMADVLRAHCRRLVVHIPIQAASAATMLALAGEEILMAPGANLSSVDTSYQHPLAPGAEGCQNRINQIELAALRTPGIRHRGSASGYEHLFPHIHPLAIGAMVRAADLAERICDHNLGYHMRIARRRRDNRAPPGKRASAFNTAATCSRMHSTLDAGPGLLAGRMRSATTSA